MKHDPIYTSFLEAEFQRGMALARASDRFTLEPMEGAPPYCYLARFNCRGLVKNEQGGLQEHDRWNVGIRFPANYLRSDLHVAEVLTFLGPAQIWHPNFRHPFVCLTIRPGEPLEELIFAVYDLLTWNVYGVGDNGLNPAAAQWARRQPAGRFPLDPRPLRRPGHNGQQP